MNEHFAVLIFVIAIAGWAAGFLWNKYEAAAQCAALERELTEKHALELRAKDAVLIEAEQSLRIALNRLQAIDEARIARPLPPRVATAVEVCDRYPKETNAQILADYLRQAAA